MRRADGDSIPGLERERLCTSPDGLVADHRVFLTRPSWAFALLMVGLLSCEKQKDVPNGVELQAQLDSMDRELDVMRFQFNRLKQDIADVGGICTRRRRR